MTTQTVTLRLVAEGGQLVGTVRSSREAVDKLGAGARQTGGQFQQLSRQSNSLGAQLGSLRAIAGGLAKSFAAGLGIGGLTAAMGAGVGSARAFGKSMAEVSTLLDDTSGLEQQRQQVRQLAQDYGTAATQQSQALYQIISAGQEGAAAMSTLDTANRLAIGGVTDIATAADGLTSVLNAYGDQVGSAVDVSDTLFVGMRQGKTTIGELSGSLGQVAPIAATVGVEFTELVSAISAVTSGGVRTAEAVTQIRGVLTSVLKPSAEAARLAQEVGLQFNTQAIAAKGLAGFLEDVRAKTGGSQEAMSTLFGSVEGLNAVFALTGNQAQQFGDNLAAMEQRAGATEAAFGKMSEEADFALNRMKSAAQDGLVSIGDSILRTIAPAALAFADNIESITGGITTVATVAAVALGGRLTGALAATARQFVVNQASAIRYQATLASMAGVSSTAAASQIALSRGAAAARGAMSLLGGPAGVITIAGAALVYFVSQLETSAERSQRLDDRLRELKGGLEAVAAAATLKELDETQRRIDRVTAEIEFLNQAAERSQLTQFQSQQLADYNTELGQLIELEGLLSERHAEQAQQAAIAASSVGNLEQEVRAAVDATLAGIPTLESFAEGVDDVHKKSREAAKAAKAAQRELAQFTQAVEKHTESLIAAEAAKIDALRNEQETLRVLERELDLVRQGLAVDDARNQAAREALALARDKAEAAGDALDASRIQAQIDAEAVTDRIRGIDQTRSANEEAADAARQAWERTGEQIQEALTDSIFRALEAGENEFDVFLDSIINTAKATAIRLSVEWVFSPITGAIQGVLSGAGIGGAGGASNALFGGGLAGITGGFGASSNALAGLFAGGFTTQGLAAALPAAGILGGAGYLGSSLLGASSGGALGGGAGSVLGYGLGAAGSLGGPVGAVIGTAVGTAVGEILAGGGGSNTRTSFAGTLDQGGFSNRLPGGYGDLFSQLGGPIGSLASGSPNLEAADRAALELTERLDTLFSDIFTLGSQAADSLGLSIGDFSHQVEGAIRLVDGQVVAESVEDIIGQVGEAADALAQSVLPGIEAFQNEGESLFDTLVRVAQNAAAVSQVLDQFGIDMDLTGAQLIQFSQDLLTHFGGSLDALAQASASFYQNFFTEAERFDTLGQNLNATLGELGLTLPASRDGFRDLVTGLDLTTEAGRATFAALLQASDAANVYYATLEQQAAAFYQRFAPAAVQFADLQAQMAAAVSAVGQTIPPTRAEFYSLVTALQSAGSAGASAAQQLIAASATADAYYTQLEQQAAQAAQQAQADAQAAQRAAQEQARAQQSAARAADQRAAQRARAEASRQSQIDRARQQAREQERRAQQQAAEEARRQAEQRRNFERSLRDQIDLIGLQGRELELERLKQDYQAKREQAREAGASLALVEQYYGRQRAAIAERYAQEALAEQQRAVDEAGEALRAAYQRQADALQSTIERFTEIARSLGDFRSELDTQGASLLNPRALYEALRSQFEQTSSLAASGDVNALASLEDVSRQFLDASQDINASSQAYFQDLDAVKSAIDLARGSAEFEASAAQTEFDLLTQQVSSLIDIEDAVLSVEQAIINLQNAQAAVGTATPVRTDASIAPVSPPIGLPATGGGGSDGDGGTLITAVKEVSNTLRQQDRESVLNLKVVTSDPQTLAELVLKEFKVRSRNREVVVYAGGIGEDDD